VEELDGGPTPLQTCGSPLRSMGFRVFFCQKIAMGLPIAIIFGNVIGGSRAHALNFF